MRRVLTGFVVACAIAFTTACNVFTESPPGSSTSTGEYTLQSVNNASLPYTMSESGGVKT